MGNSKHRKNHNKKVQAFKHRAIEEKNRTKKMQQAFFDNYMKQQENARKEYMIETIYNNRKEIVKEVDGIWKLNDEAVITVNDTLVWKTDENPILAGLEPLEVYTEYTEELVSMLLGQIQGRLKWKASKENPDNINILPVSQDEYNTVNADFQLVEDPNFKSDEKSE
jgi:hypothetical protein